MCDIELRVYWSESLRLLFDVSSTVFCAISNCEWSGVGGWDTCLMLIGLSLLAIFTCEWIGD